MNYGLGETKSLGIRVVGGKGIVAVHVKNVKIPWAQRIYHVDEVSLLLHFVTVI